MEQNATEFFPKRDTVEWEVRVYLSRAYFTAEILTSLTSLKAVFLSFPIQIEEDLFPTTLHPAYLLSEPLLSSLYNKLDYSFPPSLRDMVLTIFDLCEHSMGLFHSSSWPMQTCLETGTAAARCFYWERRSCVSQCSREASWGCDVVHYAACELCSRSAVGQPVQGKITTAFRPETSLIMIKSLLQWEQVLVRYQSWADWHAAVP